MTGRAITLAGCVALLALAWVWMVLSVKPTVEIKREVTTRTVTPAPVPAPTVTVTKTPKPRPTVTVTVQPASRSQARLGSSDEAFLACVAKRESGGNPRAQNPYSSASGVFQFIDATWRAYSREARIGASYSRAKYAPASVQWALARWVVDNKGRYPWKGGNYSC